MKICDLNVNTESEVPEVKVLVFKGKQYVSKFHFLDLKNVSDGDKWKVILPTHIIFLIMLFGN